jgi:hypothetical protein
VTALFSFLNSMLVVAFVWLAAAVFALIRGELIFAAISVLFSVLMANWYRREKFGR